MNIRRKAVYIQFSFWIFWEIKISLSSVPDPCPEIQPSTQVTDMCQAGSAVEDISESNAGNLKYDHVTLRARTQEDNCICRVFIEDQSLDRFTIYIQPYDKLQISTPKEHECGLELYLDIYDNETLQQNQIAGQIKCTSGQNDRSFSLKRNSELRFTSKVIDGNFTRGYCIDIQRVHVDGQNGTLKIVCGVPGIIPSPQYTTLESLDLSTKSSDNSISMAHFDDSTVYIASGASAGVVVIAVTAIAIFFCKRHRSQSKEPVPKDNVNMQYDSPSETRNDSNYITLKTNPSIVYAHIQAQQYYAVSGFRELETFIRVIPL